MLQTGYYLPQVRLQPRTGKHILAQADAQGIVVYQAYRPSIAAYAVEHGHFGGEFSYSRMSWIKPSFLWMMYRSGWGTKPEQEVTLAVRIQRQFFDTLLAQAITSSYSQDQFATQQEWRRAVHASLVRLQWDPDRHPSGAPLQRRALQLGLRGQALEDYGTKRILEIQDISAFVAEQREHTRKEQLDELLIPVEREYLPADRSVAALLGIDATK